MKERGKKKIAPRVPTWITKKTAITKAGCRNQLELDIAAYLENLGIAGVYEIGRIAYTKGTSHYTPDFVLPNGVVVEAKGLFLASDRTKHLLIKKQYPDLEIRFVFSNPASRLSKKSKTTYGEWCAKHEFLYAAKKIPHEWLFEKPDSVRLEALNAIKLKKCAK